jgi:hypothetical protein
MHRFDRIVSEEDEIFFGPENVPHQGADAGIIVDNQDRGHTRCRRVRVMVREEVGGPFLEEEEDGTVVICSPDDRAGVDAAPLGRVEMQRHKRSVFQPLPEAHLDAELTHVNRLAVKHPIVQFHDHRPVDLGPWASTRLRPRHFDAHDVSPCGNV